MSEILDPSHFFAGLQRKHYGAIVIDPPWHFRSHTALQSSNWHSRRDAEKHYRTLTPPEIVNLPVGDLAAKDAHLFLWTTGPCLPYALDAMKAWGFKYDPGPGSSQKTAANEPAMDDDIPF
jgi:N6-adenosine-specific RNA methylase IME4